MNKIEAVISDADGTLVDTVRLIRHGQYETAKKYLTQHGIPADEIPTYNIYEGVLNATVGGAARDTLEKTVRQLYAASPHHLDTMDFEELHDMLNPIQDEIAPEYVKPYDQLSEFLHGLGDSGIKLAIFTSGTSHHVVRNFGIALPELGLTDLYRDKTRTDEEKLGIFSDAVAKTYGIPDFTFVTAGDTSRHKPDPESLNLAMQRLNVVANQVAVLGDHKVDIQTAYNAGVEHRIGITHGFDNRQTLEEHGATHTASHLTEVSDFLTKR